MPFLISHLWTVGILFMVAYVALARFRMGALIAKGTMTDAQADRFCLVATVISAVAGVLFEAMTWASGLPIPCQFFLPITDPRLWPFLGLTLLMVAALLYWVWRRGGDRTLALVAPAFSGFAVSGKIYTPREVRLWLTFVVAVAWTGNVVARLAMPLPRFPGCAS